MPYAGGRPYGDIFVTRTSAVDNIAKQLYARQALKEQQEREDNKALDNEFSRNMSGMRDADIGDLTKAYGEFKNAHIGLQKKGNKSTPEDQIELLRRKAAVNEIIAKSKLQKEQEKQFGSAIMKDGNKFVRDAHGRLINIMNTPISKIGDNDPFAELPYKGNMNNMQKWFAAAAGKPIQMDDEVVDNPKEMRKDVTHVSRMANAYEYYNSILGQAVGSQGEDDLVRSVATNITPELYNSTKFQYEQMMADPILRKRIGMDKINLPPDEGLTEPERAAKFLAMTHQLVSKPVLKEGSPIYSQTAVMNKREAFAEKMLDKRFANSKIMAALQDQYIRGRQQNPSNPEENVGWITEDIANKYGEDMEYTPVGGQKVTRKVIFLDKADKNEINFVRGGVSPITFKGGRQGFLYDPQTKDWEGANGQKVSAERARRDVIDNVLNTKIKIGQDAKKKVVAKEGILNDLK